MYKPFEPAHKITLEQCSERELESVIRVASAVIKGLNSKHITFSEVQQVFTMPDDKAAARLGLTVTRRGMYAEHDLMGPHVWLLARQVSRTIASTVENMRALREIAQILTKII